MTTRQEKFLGFLLCGNVDSLPQNPCVLSGSFIEILQCHRRCLRHKTEKTGFSAQDITSLITSAYEKYDVATGTESGTLDSVPVLEVLPIIEVAWDMIPPKAQADILRIVLQHFRQYVQ